MKNVQTLAEQDTRLHRVSRFEWAGACPNPDCRCRSDGFRVKPHSNDFGGPEPRGAFMCRGCWDPRNPPIRPQHPRWGDDVDYVMHYQKIPSVPQAIAYLAGQEEGPTVVRLDPSQLTQQDYRSPQWQHTMEAMMKECSERLWSQEGRDARHYFRKRGLLDRTIYRAHLGYMVQGDIPYGVIPSFNNGHYVAVHRRDLRPDAPKEARWRDMPGSTKGELYLSDCLPRWERPTILAEAPLDALSVAQDCGDLVNVVATAGVSCGLNFESLHKLCNMPLVWIAFDADEAGDKAAQEWLGKLPQARRLRPLLHDLNDMLVDGYPMRQWIISNLDAWRAEQHLSATTVLPAGLGKEEQTHSEEEEEEADNEPIGASGEWDGATAVDLLPSPQKAQQEVSPPVEPEETHEQRNDGLVTERSSEEEMELKNSDKAQEEARAQYIRELAQGKVPACRPFLTETELAVVIVAEKTFSNVFRQPHLASREQIIATVMKDTIMRASSLASYLRDNQPSASVSSGKAIGHDPSARNDLEPALTEPLPGRGHPSGTASQRDDLRPSGDPLGLPSTPMPSKKGDSDIIVATVASRKSSRRSSRHDIVVGCGCCPTAPERGLR